MDYTKITPEFAADFFKLADEAKNICITAHMSADEDAVAAILATYRLLSDKYPEKDIRIIYSGELNERFRSFENFEKIQFVPDIAEHLEGFDLFVLLDGSSNYDRFTSQPEKLKAFPAKKICMDHHSSPPEKFDLALIVPEVPSTTEILYLTFFKDKPIDKSLAEILLLGILGDTGNFSFLRPDQSDTLLSAKRLIEEGGIEISALQSRYRTIEPKILAVLGEFIKNTDYHEVEGWPNFQTSFITRDFMSRNNLTDKEVGEAAELYTAFFIRSIVGYRWGFSIRSKANGQCNISLRSLPEAVNVREIVERMGLGGGHDRAAGGTFKEEGKVLEVEECLNKVLEWLKANKLQE